MTVTVGEMLTRARANVRTEADKMLLDAIEPIYEQHMLIEQLRAPEGAEVALFCDNPDFNMAPNCAIEITDDWTGWDPQRFTGDTLLDCLRAAAAARPK